MLLSLSLSSSLSSSRRVFAPFLHSSKLSSPRTKNVPTKRRRHASLKAQIIYHHNEGGRKKKERMSFFGIGPSAKLLTVDVTYTNPTRTCVVKSSNHSESTNSMNNIARETLPLITSGALFFFSSSLCCAHSSSCVILLR